MGVRKIAKRFGVDPGTAQRISRPFDGAGMAVLIIDYGKSGDIRAQLHANSPCLCDSPVSGDIFESARTRKIRVGVE
jgi:hypothetical protein